MRREIKAVFCAGVAMVFVLLFTAGCLIANRPITPRAVIQWRTGAPPVPPKVPQEPTLDLHVAYAPLIQDAAERNNLSPLLVAAMTRVESDFDPFEVSNKGARGLMQVMPETGRRFGVPPEHLFDPERNIAAGTAYMSWLLERYHGDLDLALAGYNAGEGAVDKYAGIPPYRETQNYVRKVRAELAALQQSVLVSGL